MWPWRTSFRDRLRVVDAPALSRFLGEKYISTVNYRNFE
jgi:hypothetical protein